MIREDNLLLAPSLATILAPTSPSSSGIGASSGRESAPLAVPAGPGAPVAKSVATNYNVNKYEIKYIYKYQNK